MHKFVQVLTIISPLVILPGKAVAAMPDWWLIFGSGDQPKRQVMYADALSVADSPSKSGVETARTVEVVQVFEDQGKPSYIWYTIAFQCKAGQYWVDVAKAKKRSGEVVEEPNSRQWMPVAQSVLERPYDFVCKASTRRSNNMIKISKPQLIDTLAQFTYETFWATQQ
ncbi:hypothetical protein K5D38_12440 [Pseudomonas cichorii]|nr:hypothetical protein [Pseudomonas cichorii]MBX8475590.1 hypothetical protein [Pseudomonas cichorii]